MEYMKYLIKTDIKYLCAGKKGISFVSEDKVQEPKE